MEKMSIPTAVQDLVTGYVKRNFPLAGLASNHFGVGLRGIVYSDLVGLMGEIIVLHYLKRDVMEYLNKRPVNATDRGADIKLVFGDYDVKAVGTTVDYFPAHYKNNVAEHQWLTCKADGFIFCRIRKDNLAIGTICGFISKADFARFSQFHKYEAGSDNKEFEYLCNTYDITNSHLINPRYLNALVYPGIHSPPVNSKEPRHICRDEETDTFCRHIFYGSHEELMRKGEPCPNWHKHT